MDLYAGITTPEERRERVRQLIIKRGVAEFNARPPGKPPESFKEIWERLYGLSFFLDDLPEG